MALDGLSRLPPIRLRPEEDMLDEKTPMASSFDRSFKSEDHAEDDNPESPDFGYNAAEGPTSGGTQEISELQNSDSTATIVPGDVQTKKDPPSALTGVDETAEKAPLLTISPAPPTPTPVSGDLILPLMIFAVVKANPPRLVSHLLYTQRFRYQGIGGEESYCLINLLADAEFLENVDLAALGLGESEKTVMRYVNLLFLYLSSASSD